MESHGSFHGIYSWKLQLMEVMEASTSTDSGNFYQVCIFVEASTKFHGSNCTSVNFHENFHASKSTSTDFHGRFAFMEIKVTSKDVSGKFHESRSNK